MKQKIKICGLSTPEAVEAAVSGGATHLGFIFFEKSPRNVSAQTAGILTGSLHSQNPSSRAVQTVAVTVDASDQDLDHIVEHMRPDMLQLHGSESVQRIIELKARHQLPVIKALAIREPADLEKVRTYDEASDLLLLDAKPPKGSELPGGNGVRFDWSVLKTLKSKTPILLSGGIDLNNVDEAMDYVGSGENSVIGLDVSSGVESAPGAKDISKIEMFLAACQ